MKLFGKQVEKLGQRKAERLKETVALRAQLEQHMGQFREQNKQVQAQLDQSIDTMEARLADLINVVQYDANRLETKFLKHGIAKDEKVACLIERTDISRCYSQTKNANACDPFFRALELCVSKTIAK